MFVLIKDQYKKIKNYKDKMKLAGYILSKLRVVNCEHVKLDGIESLSEMTELYLQNLEIDNIDNVSGLDKLEYINLNGTRVKKLTDILKNPKIKVDHEEKNYIFDVEE